MIEWVRSSVNSPLPPNAFHVGQDGDGAEMYVGRAIFRGDILPAKVIPRRREAYVSHSGREHEITHYEVLVGQRFDWIGCGDGLVPNNAISTGKASTGENIYIGRAVYENTVTVGKIQQSCGCLYLSYQGKEISIRTYEVLVSS
ncbi:uncharacterized protein LOC6638252 [Drosophila willistoni]|uniref:uncharacterized protein LOC6638252 n=1 Tax=Drosophila willistoni TaxID=7260 RepID=UPI000C26C576|nr:uncharacterized protein LOC6638252 [Drosophila willistoni]